MRGFMQAYVLHVRLMLIDSHWHLKKSSTSEIEEAIHLAH